MDKRVAILFLLILFNIQRSHNVQANFLSTLFHSFSKANNDEKAGVERHKRITSDQGKNEIGLQVHGFRIMDSFENEEEQKRSVEEDFSKILKTAEKNDLTKLKVRSLDEDENSYFSSKPSIIEQSATLREENNNQTKEEPKHIPTRLGRSHFEKVNSREEKEMSSIKTLSSNTVPITKNDDNQQSGSGEDDDTSISEAFNWPKGRYALPKSVYGCPTTFGFEWKTGFRYHDTEDDGTENQRSDVFHLAANFSEDGISHEFCVKDEVQGEGEWPSGKYCIYKRGPTCPKGLKEGFVIWDDENTDNQNDKGGALPEGQYTEDTKIYFCCSTHGFTDKDISLPAKKPFFLFAYESLKCQKILNMKATSEFIKFDDEDHGNTDYEGGVYPYGIHRFQKDHMLFLCYYEPKKEVSSFTAEPAIVTNLEEENNSSSDIDQESLRQGEEMMKAFMKATGGVEDETNKRERTKTIIKTIKIPVGGKGSPLATIIGLVLGSFVIGTAFVFIAKLFIGRSTNYQHSETERNADVSEVKPWTNSQAATKIHHIENNETESVGSDNSESIYTARENDSWSDLEGDDDELVEDQLLPDSELKTGLELLFLKQQRHYWNQRKRHERRDDSR